ncbi:hypothetical protein FVO59_06350 [Microbacterium esteraromaticum]|uniref:Uncharacterized protein n=1 Tax=Microbacterium esteraromaticum TaxID=57043 RepID=A0A7D8ABN0_9MICO|nr:hypothetical protein [Microbacterium esteraromaticum]QMU96884.1 hypothetical protein FVO59_06350 [Microbacterium esteraromaticum]
MSDSTPQNQPAENENEPTGQELLANGLDDGTGDPNDDRAYLMDTAPAQVDDEAVREHAAEEDAADERDAGE